MCVMKKLNFDTIEKEFFNGGNPWKKLLSTSLALLEAKQTGILYGTNDTKIKFLPTSLWDRGVMDKFDGRGVSGFILRLLGTYIVTAKKLSPVLFYKKSLEGEIRDNDGIISYVLRNSAD